MSDYLNETFLDLDGDRLVLSGPDSGGAFGVRAESKAYRRSSTYLAVSGKEMERLATTILEAQGKRITPLSALKSAKDVSFNEGMLRLAVIHKRQVTFRYAKDKGNFIEQRNLNPTEVTEDGASVLGLDPDREDVRRYRLDRIKGEVAFA